MFSRIISITKMAEALRLHAVKKGEFQAYMLIYMAGVLTYTLEYLGVYSPVEKIIYNPAFLYHVDFGLFIIVTFASLIIAHSVNKEGDGKDFWYRFFSISFPISIRITLIAIVVAILLYVIGVLSLDYSGYVDIGLLCSFLYIWNVPACSFYAHYRNTNGK